MKNTLKNYKYLTTIKTLLTQQEKKKFAWLLYLMIFSALLETVSIGMLIPFITLLLQPTSFQQHAWFQKLHLLFENSTQVGIILFGAIFLVFLFAIKNSMLFYLQVKRMQFVFNNKKRITLRLFKKYLWEDYNFHIQQNHAKLVKNLKQETALFASKLMMGLLTFLTQGIISIFILSFLLIYDWRATTILASILIIAALFYGTITQKMLMQNARTSQKLLSRTIATTMESLRNIKEIICLNKRNFFIEQLKKSLEISTKSDVVINVITTSARFFLEFVVVCAVLSLMAAEFWFGVDPTTIVIKISVFAAAALRILPSVNQVVTSLSMMTSTIPTLELLSKEMNTPDNLAMLHDAKYEKQHKTKHFNQNIKFNNVSFKYPRTKDNVISNINFEINKGDSIAIIGRSGAGKSTLVDLLIGLLKPSSGEILIDGHPLDYFSLNWMTNIGYVPQSYYLVDDSIKANIALGIDNEEIDLKRIEKLLSLVNLSDFIQSLEQGLETSVGENGIRLSGGQKQRLCIARALYNDPDIIILDEGTSSLDITTEKQIISELNQIAKQKTIIIVSHRPETIVGCNKIYEVSQGTVTLKNQK